MHLRTLATAGLLLIASTACSGSGTSAPPSTAVPAPPLTAGTSPTASDVTNGTATAITERDFSFDTPAVTVHGAVSLAVTNAGPTVHNLAIRATSGQILATTHDLKPGTSETLAVQIPQGTYAIICTLPGHESLGLKGTLTVGP